MVMVSAAGPAFGKAHLQPQDTVAKQLGQANADATSPSGARNGDAKAIIDDQKGVVGQTFSDTRKAVGGTESGQKSGDMTKPNASQ
jgi:hypothetical protein